MKGNLAQTNLADLVLELYYSRQSGILQVVQGNVTKKLYFKDGSIVFAHSSLDSERLGEILLRLGKITEDEFKIVQKEVEAGKRLGKALSERGFASPSDITAGVNYQLQQIIYSVFNWSEGEYEFTQRDRPVFEDIMVNVSTPEILLDGIRNITNLTVLLHGIGEDDTQVVAVNTGMKRMKRSNLDFAEETILACLDERGTIEKLKTMTHLAPHELGRALYSLLISGILVKEKQLGAEDKFRAEVNQRWLSFTTDPGVRNISKEPMNRLKTASEEEILRMIAETAQRCKTGSDEEVLGVLPDCTLHEVETAYDRMTAVYQPLFYSEQRYQAHKEELKLILDRLASAIDAMKAKLSERRPLMELTTEEMAPAGSDSSQSDSAEEAEDLHKIKTGPSKAYAPPQEKASAEEKPPVVEKPKEHLSDLEAALRKDPNNTALLKQFGKRLQQVGRAREGEKHLLRVLELEPQNVDSHFALADFYQAQGLRIKAFKHLNIVLQLQPENEKALEQLGVKKRSKGMYEISRDHHE